MKKWYLSGDFLRLWVGLAVSYLGDALFLVGFMWIAVTRGSVSAPAIIIALQTLPMALLGPFVGVMIDRLSKRLLMIGSDLIRAAIILLVLVLNQSGLLTVWHLYIVAFVLGTFELIYRPLVRILVPTLVPAEALASANSLFLGTQQLTAIFGAISGGVIVAAVGPQAILAFDAATFLFAAGMLFSITFTQALSGKRLEGSRSVKGVLSEVLAGVHYVVTRRDILVLLLTIAGLNLAVSPVNALLPAYAIDALRGDSLVLGLLYAAQGLGMLLGNIFVSLWASRISLLISLVTGLSMMAVGVMGMSLLQIPVLSILSSFAAGLGVPFVFTPTFTYLQRTVPLEYQGRVFALQQSTATVAVPLGAFLAAVAATTFSVGGIFASTSLGLCLVAALAIASGKIRNLPTKAEEIGESVTPP